MIEFQLVGNIFAPDLTFILLGLVYRLDLENVIYNNLCRAAWVGGSNVRITLCTGRWLCNRDDIVQLVRERR